MSRQVDLGQIVPNIQVGTTTTSSPSSQASVVNVGTDLNPILNFTIPKGEAGAIKMLIVNELPATGADNTIYLVPLENPDVQGNNYAEYVYINGAWELLGKIGVQVDLTDYVCFDDWANYNVPGVVKIGKNYIDMDSNGYLMANISNYDDYANIGNYSFIGKGTLENVITGKGLVSNTDYASSSTGGVIKTDTRNGTSIGTGTRTGVLIPTIVNYNNYSSMEDYAFIGKGTLENVITGKGLVSNTNYASNSVAGVVKGNVNGFLVNASNGTPSAKDYTYSQYSSLSDYAFIGKATLENVLTAKIGDINSVLDAINGEVI